MESLAEELNLPVDKEFFKNKKEKILENLFNFNLDKKDFLFKDLLMDKHNKHITEFS